MSIWGSIAHGLASLDPTGIAGRATNAAEGVWNNNAAHGTEPVNNYHPKPNPFFNQQPTLNLPPDATAGQTGQVTGQPVQQQPQGGWTYVQGQGPVWQGGGGNRF